MECDQHQAAASPAAAAAHLREERQWMQHPLPSPAVQAVRRQQEQQWGSHCGHTTQRQPQPQHPDGRSNVEGGSLQRAQGAG
ncbi:hypothetical protein HaLaN_17724 [Haematococcus lacustris]|uniref:Uncharacterized protein n=1 Tax=Haematococcus lacustris TaxID=44745 RepID=A0A699ZLV6_HAELA|nr:hypothetical protein HaLaN_17724 [Haematococcus lacustris]